MYTHIWHMPLWRSDLRQYEGSTIVPQASPMSLADGNKEVAARNGDSLSHSVSVAPDILDPD